MISIAFKEGQGLGNQLWNYVICRCLAKKLKLDFFVADNNNFKGKNFLELDYGRILDTSNFKVFNERFYFDDEINYISHFYDERILDVKKNTFWIYVLAGLVALVIIGLIIFLIMWILNKNKVHHTIRHTPNLNHLQN